MNEERRVAKRNRMIDTATELFRRFGYARTSLNDIADAAGVGKATLYHYFAGKEEILAAVMERAFDGYRGEVRTALAETADPADKLRVHARVLLRFHERLAREGSFNPLNERDALPDLRRHLLRFAAMEHQMIVGVLEEGVAAGRFRPIDTGVVATLLVASFRGMVAEFCLRQGSQGGAPAEEAILSQFMRILFHGLIASDAGGAGPEEIEHG